MPNPAVVSAAVKTNVKGLINDLNDVRAGTLTAVDINDDVALYSTNVKKVIYNALYLADSAAAKYLFSILNSANRTDLGLSLTGGSINNDPYYKKYRKYKSKYLSELKKY
jgi:hypothetical protein